MNKLVLVAMGLLTFGVIGCKDDGDDLPPEIKDKTRTEMLTEGSWRVEEGTIVPSIDIDIAGNVITVDEYWDLLAYQGGGQVMDCDKDNVMLMHMDSSVVLDEGPTKCDVNDPQTEDGGDWFFINDETQINFSSFPFDPTGAPQVLDIDTLTESNLTIEMVYVFTNPIDGSKTNHIIKLNYVNTK